MIQRTKNIYCGIYNLLLSKQYEHWSSFIHNASFNQGNILVYECKFIIILYLLIVI